MRFSIAKLLALRQIGFDSGSILCIGVDVAIKVFEIFKFWHHCIIEQYDWTEHESAIDENSHIHLIIYAKLSNASISSEILIAASYNFDIQ